MLETLSNYAGIIQWVLAAFCGWIWWSIKGRFTSKDDHNQLEKRVTAIETAVKNLPTIADHHELLVKVIEMNGNVKNTQEKVGRVQLQTDRVETFLFEGKFNQ